MSEFNTSDLLVIAEGKPVTVTFGNYEQLKAKLEKELQYYNDCEYTPDDINLATKNRDDLKNVKKTLDDKKKEIEKTYKLPYNEVISKLDSLIKMVKEPLNTAEDIIKSNEDIRKTSEIYSFAKEKAAVLGEQGDKVISSPAFFNSKWLNTSYRTKEWQKDIEEKISNAVNAVQTIQMTAGEHTPALLAYYYETLSLDRAKQFINSIKEAAGESETEIEIAEECIAGYKTLKIFASERQMFQLLTQLDLMGIDFEELEDGMPKPMEETREPSFDSFVAFDIEHTGTFGAANGDAEAEIIEIGAVKVINGEIVEKFDELCNPGRKIVPRIARLTHITDDMVADKLPVDEIIKKFKAFAGDYYLVGHNIKGCDIPHISRAAKRAGVAFENTYLDTRILANTHKAEQGWSNIKLTTLSEFFGITQNEAHRAWCDAEANAYVYLKLKELSERH